jgi:Domain of unknown function (DUF4326)
MPMIDVCCTKCRRRYGFAGEMTACPPCPRCGHRPDPGQLAHDQALLDQARRELLRVDNPNSDDGRTVAVNVREAAPGSFIYVGRANSHFPASPFGNPFRPGRDGTRTDCLAKYRDWLLSRPELLALLPALKGKRLGCWCKPLACHADILAELADAGGDVPGEPAT